MTYNIKEFNATGDGSTLDGHAIQAAIDAAHAAGGGVVRVPQGTYLTGMLTLQSNVELYIEKGATIRSVDVEEHFTVICEKPFNEAPGVIRALLFADNAKNITVSGEGTLHGAGTEALEVQASKSIPFRPELVFFRNCKDVHIKDVTLAYSSFWNCHLMRCEDVRIRGVVIENELARINTDGIDIDGCRNVTISDCHITSGDDSIVIKSTEGDVCENIAITNCVLHTGHGALKLGTEAMGAIRNITVTNCIIPSFPGKREESVGIALYMKDGSAYENVTFSNIIIEGHEKIAIFIDNRPRYHKTDKAGVINNIAFSNIRINGAGRLYVEGHEENIASNLTFSNITWRMRDSEMMTWNPVGSARTDHDPNAVKYMRNNYQLAFVHARFVIVRDVMILRETDTDDRGVLYLANVTDSVFENIRTTMNVGTFGEYKEEDTLRTTVSIQTL